jgi:uncharacterized SAM-binding protein YcdF (DUF218 family)
MAILDTAGNGSWGKGGRQPVEDGRRPVFARLARAFAFGLFAASLLIGAGFLVFLSSMDRTEPNAVRRADGVVALTGGAERIGDALQRLGAGGGKRLLISGVAHDVTAEKLAAREPELRRWLHCCVDLGHAARNTVGNAKEIRHWALTHGYRSLLVVTSSYHMPRSLVELRRQLPDIELIPAPVVTAKLQAMDFWRHPELLKTIGVEYLKFIAASARAALTPARPMGEISDTATKRRA